jgi:hypothetical protein
MKKILHIGIVYLLMWFIPPVASAQAQLLKLGGFDDVIEIKIREGDQFQSVYNQHFHYFGIVIQSGESITHRHSQEFYESLSKEKKSLSLAGAELFILLAVVYIVSYVIYHVAIVIPRTIFSAIMAYVAKYKKFIQASDKYIELGGNDKTIIQILSHLKYKQVRDIYVSFECDNQLPADSPTSMTDYNGEEIKVFSPHDKFLPKNVLSFEKNTIEIMNSCFSKIIDQDLLEFVKTDNIDNQKCKKHVCFKLGYTVSISFDFNFVDNQLLLQPRLYSCKDNTKQQFYGITVSWNIDIILHGKSIRNLQFSCSPAESFTVYTSYNEDFIAKVFDKMVETSFADLEKNLTTELQLTNLLDSSNETDKFS